MDYTPYLQIYYTFDNTDTVGGNAQDLSDNNYHALSTSVTTSLTGIRNEAHGTDDINDLINTQKTASNLNIGEPTKNRTIIIWTNTTNWGTNLFLWWMGGGSGGGFGLRSDANTDIWDFATGNAAYDIENMNIRTNNHWEMITATYNGTHLTVYANTTLVGTNKNSYSTTDTYNLAIGYSPGGGSSHRGVYDDFCVWNQTLPLSAIEELYNNGAGSTCLGTTQTSTANETEGDNAIETAINSSLTSPTKYKSQKVYVANSSDMQWKGTIDYLILQNSPQRRWLINYVTSGESFLNAPNLSNIVYVLEIENKTSLQIIQEVSLLINSTK
ncbi:hypothetical protein HYU12_03315 [Candidatus Woesearchaeota archaeon]|nr:hypothetical protein [Candidatus Woesearchaeota archaeon]